MILLGCLLAFGLAVAPRIFLVLAWIFSARWPFVWQGDWLVPLLGIIFLPYTTIMYMLVWAPNGIDGWDWLWILLGVLLDVWKWQQVVANRKAGMEQAQRYYPSGSSGSGYTSAAVSSGQVPPSTSPTAVDAQTAPPAAAVPDDVPEEGPTPR